MSEEAVMGQANASTGERPCTCHPDDNPPVPCPRKYALTECRAAAIHAELLAQREELVQALEETEREYYERAASIHCTTGMVPGRFNITHKLRVAALARAAQPLPHGE